MSITAILDVDGTLVDTNYQHALAWWRALVAHGATPPIWRVHRHIGMGGDQLVAAIAGAAFDREHGDSMREAEKREYAALIGEVRAMDGARELIAELRRRGHAVVLASSASEGDLDHYLDLLDARELAGDTTTSADVEATKPAPDLVVTAMRRAGGLSAVMIGDTPWDVEAAERAEVKTIGVLTGGFSEGELRDAGAIDVFESLVTLREALDRTPLRG